MATRTGHIHETRRPYGTYYTATVCIGYRNISRCSYDRSEVAAWLAGMLAENPTYEFPNRRRSPRTEVARRMAMGDRPVPRSNPFAAAKVSVTETPSLWMVVAETNPMTAKYHIRVRADWPRPKKVLTYDLLSESPVAWVADDNGGEGYGSREGARVAALAIGHDPSVMLTVRPLARRWRDGGTDENRGEA